MRVMLLFIQSTQACIIDPEIMNVMMILNIVEKTTYSGKVKITKKLLITWKLEVILILITYLIMDQVWGLIILTGC